MDNSIIVGYLQGLGYRMPTGGQAQHMRAWLDWYRGYVSDAMTMPCGWAPGAGRPGATA